jgi:hypothetical protein
MRSKRHKDKRPRPQAKPEPSDPVVEITREQSAMLSGLSLGLSSLLSSKDSLVKASEDLKKQ